jgi:hypothetical protein
MRPNDKELFFPRNEDLTPAQQSLLDYVKKVKNELDPSFTTQEGRACNGEPSVDPSKLVHPNQGDSEWIDEW